MVGIQHTFFNEQNKIFDFKNIKQQHILLIFENKMRLWVLNVLIALSQNVN